MPTTRYLVPIRFWEDKAPILFDETKRFTHSVYGYHHQYEHTCYVQVADLFETDELCRAEIERRTQEMAAKDDAAFNDLWERVMASSVFGKSR